MTVHELGGFAQGNFELLVGTVNRLYQDPAYHASRRANAHRYALDYHNIERLLPLFAWYWASANSGGVSRVPAPHEMAWRSGQEIVFLLWLFGVPILAGGLAFGAVPFVRAAGWSLLAATVLDSAQAAIVLRHALRTSPPIAGLVSNP